MTSTILNKAQRRPLPRLAAVAMARYCTTRAELFAADVVLCQICGQRGHCSADCRRGMVLKGRSVGASVARRRIDGPIWWMSNPEAALVLHNHASGNRGLA